MGEGALLELAQVSRPAVVLGSAQRDLAIDPGALSDAGSPDVTRRRGGGGAVWVAPGAGWWFDVTIPRSDPRWSDDVGAAFLWLGDALASWLGELELEPRAQFEVHRGGLVRSPWSSAVCFAGLGPGEVTVDGRKLIGISQRRTRDAARFMCWMPSAWSVEPLAELVLAGPRPGSDGVVLSAAATELAGVGVGWLDLHDAPPTWSVGGVDDPVAHALVG